eukprot:10137904-Karenia_brevis.AAC.1
MIEQGGNEFEIVSTEQHGVPVPAVLFMSHICQQIITCCQRFVVQRRPRKNQPKFFVACTGNTSLSAPGANLKFLRDVVERDSQQFSLPHVA